MVNKTEDFSQDTASQAALRDCSKEVREEPYIVFATKTK